MPRATTFHPVSPGSNELLTLEEAAQYLKISPGTLKHWVAWKRLEHIKLGRLTRFRKSALDRYLTAQTIPAVSQ